MSCPGREEEIHDLLDGLLGPREARRASEHLVGCAGCQATFAALQRLRDAAAALPRVEEPPRDLWPSIRSAARAARAVRRFPLARRLPGAAPWLAAAAVLAVFAGVAVLRAPGPADGGGRDATLASMHAAEDEFVRAARDLHAALDARREGLSPEARAVLDRNLQIIDEAIRDLWIVLERGGPGSTSARQMTYLQSKKLEMLEQAVHASGWGER